MSIIMGCVGNAPLALAAGLGVDSILAYTVAPTMSWPDAMGLVVIEGLGICLLVLTGLRKRIMDAIPLPLKRAIGAGVGLFICLIGLVDAGFVTATGSRCRCRWAAAAGSPDGPSSCSASVCC